jgi:hypothetical protein
MALYPALDGAKDWDGYRQELIWELQANLDQRCLARTYSLVATRQDTLDRILHLEILDTETAFSHCV